MFASLPFLQSSLALISECGTDKMRRAKSVKASDSPGRSGNNEGSIFIAAYYHYRLQLRTACSLFIARVNGFQFV